MPTSSQVPWKRRNPRKASGKPSQHLSAEQKATAKARARRAGRHYPNLVDNMTVAGAKKSTAKTRSSSKKTPRKSATNKPNDS